MRQRLAPWSFVGAAVVALTGCVAGEVEGGGGEVESLGEDAAAQVVCAAGPTVEGIDVSYWQQHVDWQAVADAGIQFAIARVSHGTRDTFFDANWAGIKAAGLVRGAYQYYLADHDPLEQAELMIEAIGTLQDGDLPPVIDIESHEGQDRETILAGLRLWLDRVEGALGRKPIIYTGKYFWQDFVASDEFVDHPLWIPNYSNDCPNLPNGTWSDWTFFQYSSTGSVPGISGNVDRNHFNGSLEMLHAFAQNRPALAAEFVSQSFPYASQGALKLRAGEVVEASIELRNVGSRAWDTGTYLAATEPRGRESVFTGPEWPSASRFAAVEGKVMPGESYRFTFALHAPSMPGVYDEFFGLVQVDGAGERWFSDAGQGGPPDDQLEGIFEVLPALPGDPVEPGEPVTPEERPRDDGEYLGTSGLCAARPGTSPGTAGAWLLVAMGTLVAGRRRRR
ncbi:GH25 family lysozyme [Chondromyces crocatus]|nr:GH25 family lysozyme [Chondromyces crocatus]